MGELRLMSEDGDLKIVWDPENDDEVAAVESKFDELVGKGFKAFSVKKNGNRGVEIKEFDPGAGKIILVPKIVGG